MFLMIFIIFKIKIRYTDFYSRGDEIRTHDLFVPNEALYQAEPHPDTLLHIISNREKVESENLLL